MANSRDSRVENASRNQKKQSLSTSKRTNSKLSETHQAESKVFEDTTSNSEGVWPKVYRVFAIMKKFLKQCTGRLHTLFFSGPQKTATAGETTPQIIEAQILAPKPVIKRRPTPAPHTSEILQNKASSTENTTNNTHVIPKETEQNLNATQPSEKRLSNKISALSSIMALFPKSIATRRYASFKEAIIGEANRIKLLRKQSLQKTKMEKEEYDSTGTGIYWKTDYWKSKGYSENNTAAEIVPIKKSVGETSREGHQKSQGINVNKSQPVMALQTKTNQETQKTVAPNTKNDSNHQLDILFNLLSTHPELVQKEEKPKQPTPNNVREERLESSIEAVELLHNQFAFPKINKPIQQSLFDFEEEESPKELVKVQKKKKAKPVDEEYIPEEKPKAKPKANKKVAVIQGDEEPKQAKVLTMQFDNVKTKKIKKNATTIEKAAKPKVLEEMASQNEEVFELSSGASHQTTNRVKAFFTKLKKKF